MSKVRVVIATSEGPVEVDRITPEEAAQSMVCLRRTAQALPISAAYDAFVRRPSGVIDREFPRAPPGAYRLDLSAPVTNGESWQLGVFVAHALAAEGRLAASGETCGTVIIATGRVDNDLQAQPVDRIAEKAHALRPLLEDLQSRGTAVRLVVPPGNRAGFEAAGFTDRVAPIAVANAWAACAEAGLAPPAGKRFPGRSGPPRMTAMAAGLLAVALAGGAIALIGPERLRDMVARAPEPASLTPAPPTQPPVSSTPSVPVAAAADIAVPPPPARMPDSAMPIGSLPASLVVSELVAPAGTSCPQVHMGSATAIAMPVERATAESLAPGRQKPVCGLRFTVTAEKPLHVGLTLRVTSGRYVEAVRKPALLEGSAPFTGTQSWEISLPSGQALAYSIAAMAGEAPVSDFVRRAAAGPDLPPAVRGIELLSLRHEVVP